MEVCGWLKTYNTFGGGGPYARVADLLFLELGEYGESIREFDLTGCVPSATRDFLPTLEQLFDRYHEYLQSLPRVTFRRTRQRVELEFCSEQLVHDGTRRLRDDVSTEDFNIASAEVLKVIPLVRKRIRKDDDFDFDRFQADAERLLGEPMASLEELERIHQSAVEKRMALNATRSPWELLDVDWERFHPSARELLDDVFFWDCTDDLAPHGNDTGADLLEDFLEWNSQHPRTAPRKFLDQLLQAWGIEPISWDTVDAEEIARLREWDAISLRVCNEAAIALAFAVIKVRGKCPADVRDLARAALTRTALGLQESAGTHPPDEWEKHLTKMRGKLR